MNPASLAIAFMLLGFVIVYVGSLWHFKKRVWSKKKRKWICGSLLVTGLLLTCYIYTGDADNRAVTLFEVSEKWESAGAKNWTVEVESPNVPHLLMIAPRPLPFTEAQKPLQVRVRLTPRKGGPVFDERMDFPIIVESNRSGVHRAVWDSSKLVFTPHREGIHQLTVEPFGPLPPFALIRIEDPTKTDGVRSKGY